MARDATAGHQMAPTPRAALSRALLGAVLLAVGGKDSESVQLEIRGNGPFGAVVALSDQSGRARGYVADPSVNLPMRDGKLDVAGGIGLGLLTVSRRRPGWPAPHTGTVALATSEVAQDLAHYLLESEQIPSAVGLGVAIDVQGDVEAAGGFLIQVLPDADDAVVARVEANVRSIASTAALVRSGVAGDGLLDLLLSGVDSGKRYYAAPSFHCPCSRDRALRTLSLLGSEQLGATARSGGAEEVICHFCGARYHFSAAELQGLLEKMIAPS